MWGTLCGGNSSENSPANLPRPSSLPLKGAEEPALERRLQSPLCSTQVGGGVTAAGASGGAHTLAILTARGSRKRHPTSCHQEATAATAALATAAGVPEEILPTGGVRVEPRVGGVRAGALEWGGRLLRPEPFVLPVLPFQHRRWRRASDVFLFQGRPLICRKSHCLLLGN